LAEADKVIEEALADQSYVEHEQMKKTFVNLANIKH